MSSEIANFNSSTTKKFLAGLQNQIDAFFSDCPEIQRDIPSNALLFSVFAYIDANIHGRNDTIFLSNLSEQYKNQYKKDKFLASCSLSERDATITHFRYYLSFISRTPFQEFSCLEDALYHFSCLTAFLLPLSPSKIPSIFKSFLSIFGTESTSINIAALAMFPQKDAPYTPALFEETSGVPIPTLQLINEVENPSKLYHWLLSNAQRASSCYSFPVEEEKTIPVFFTLFTYTFTKTRFLPNHVAQVFCSYFIQDMETRFQGSSLVKWFAHQTKRFQQSLDTFSFPQNVNDFPQMYSTLSDAALSLLELPLSRYSLLINSILTETITNASLPPLPLSQYYTPPAVDASYLTEYIEELTNSFLSSSNISLSNEWIHPILFATFLYAIAKPRGILTSSITNAYQLYAAAHNFEDHPWKKCLINHLIKTFQPIFLYSRQSSFESGLVQIANALNAYYVHLSTENQWLLLSILQQTASNPSLPPIMLIKNALVPMEEDQLILQQYSFSYPEALAAQELFYIIDTQVTHMLTQYPVTREPDRRNLQTILFGIYAYSSILHLNIQSSAMPILQYYFILNALSYGRARPTIEEQNKLLSKTLTTLNKKTESSFSFSESLLSLEPVLLKLLKDYPYNFPHLIDDLNQFLSTFQLTEISARLPKSPTQTTQAFIIPSALISDITKTQREKIILTEEQQWQTMAPFLTLVVASGNAAFAVASALSDKAKAEILSLLLQKEANFAFPLIENIKGVSTHEQSTT